MVGVPASVLGFAGNRQSGSRARCSNARRPRIEAGIQDAAVHIDGGSDHVRERTKPVAKPPIPSGDKDHGLTMLPRRHRDSALSRASTIRTCIASVSAQTNPAVEHTIVDGAFD
jgi:hypothetical protein